MEFASTRFGRISVEPDRIISFPEGLPGFERLREFVLLYPEETRPLFWLQSVEEGGIALPLIQTFEIIADYSIDIYEGELQTLQTNTPEDLMVMSVVVIPQDVRQMTANLAAPILVNSKCNIGKQIVVDASGHDTRQPIFQDICRVMRGGDSHAGAHTQG